MANDSLIGQRWEVMREALDERQRRLLVGVEAKVLGRGGVSAVAVATGVSRTTILAGLNEIELMKSSTGTADKTVNAPTSTRQAGPRIDWCKAQAQSPRVPGFLALLAVGVKRPRTNLDGSNNYRFVMDAAPFALGASADKCLIHFDWILSANRVTFRAHHASAELVQNLEGGLVAQSQLSLKLHCRHARRLRRHQVSSPEPCGQRRMALLHDGASRKRDIGMAGAAPQYDRPSTGKTVRLTNVSALGTRKTIRPPQVLKVP